MHRYTGAAPKGAGHVQHTGETAINVPRQIQNKKKQKNSPAASMQENMASNLLWSFKSADLLKNKQM